MSFPSESDLSGTIARLFVYPVKSCAGIEVQQALEAARIGVEQGGEVVSGTVRLTCTEAVMHSLLLPALAELRDGLQEQA